MKTKTIIIWVLIVIAFSLFIYFSDKQPAKYEELAKCLTEKGVIMYGTEWCSHCQNQKSLFGSAFKFINYVDCDRDKGRCTDAGVQGYPTWNINGENYPGEQSINRLKDLTGCEIDGTLNTQ